MQQKNPTARSPAALWERIKGNRKALYAAYALLAGAALLLYFFGTTRNQNKTLSESTAGNRSAETVSTSEPSLEERLSRILSSIRGAGQVEVLITYETTGEIVQALSSRIDEDIRDAAAGSESTIQRSTSTVSEPATVKSGEGQTPIVLMEKEATVRGVIVVADGASDLSVRMNLQRAVQAATGIPIGQIEVFERSGETP